MVCITSQQFHHALTEDGTTILPGSRHEQHLPQEAHLNYRCHQWMQRPEQGMARARKPHDLTIRRIIIRLKKIAS